MMQSDKTPPHIKRNERNHVEKPLLAQLAGLGCEVEALKKYRTGGEQKVTVEHVHVNEGGQAVIGNVGRGEDANKK